MHNYSSQDLNKDEHNKLKTPVRPELILKWGSRRTHLSHKDIRRVRAKKGRRTTKKQGNSVVKPATRATDTDTNADTHARRLVILILHTINAP